MKPTFFCLCLLIGSVSLPLSAATIHVPTDQPTIQAGVDAAVDGDIVLVADGTYSGAGNHDILVDGKEITIRSENGAEHCIIDCEGDGRGFRFNETAPGINPVLEGFTIRNGYAGDGGAITIYGAFPVIRDNILEYNQAALYGGAIFGSACDVVIEGNLIRNNLGGFERCAAGREGGATGGGGICLQGSWSGLILVQGNSITGNVGSGFGGGVLLEGGLIGIISDNVITGNSAGCGGGLAALNTGASIADNVFSGNEASEAGGGLYTIDATLFMDRLTFTGNSADEGGGLYSGGNPAQVSLADAVFEENEAQFGGGLYVTSTLDADRIRVERNSAVVGGGAYFHESSYTSVSHSLFTGNTADRGAAVRVSAQSGHPLSVHQSTISGNTAGEFGGALLVIDASAAIMNSILWDNAPDEVYASGGDPEIIWSAVDGGFAGEGNIDEDPLFVSGPFGDHYLSHVAAGQPADSPCIDAGGPSGSVYDGTTRTDSHADHGIADMGYHYPFTRVMLVVAGAGPGPANPSEFDSIYARSDTRLAPFNGDPYGVQQYGVNVAAGDIDGDGFDELLTGPGPSPNLGPHVRALDIGGPIPGVSFLAYGTPKFGVNVAAGDLDGNGIDEILTGAGPGAVYGPHVRAFAYDGSSTAPVPGVSFLAYGTPKWGVNLAAGDLDGDGYDEIITGAGQGAVYGPHVRGWNVDAGIAAPITGLSWFAYGSLHFGVRVACGDVDGDGIAEIITAPGPSAYFPAHVRGWDVDGGQPVPLPDFSFFAWDWRWTRWGAIVHAAADLDDDGRTEIVVGAGPDHRVEGRVNVYNYDDGTVTPWIEFVVDDEHAFGVNVTAGWFEMQGGRPVR